MSRDVMVVGGGDPAASLANGLTGNVRLATPAPAEVDDDFVERFGEVSGSPIGGLDLVVHALYPQASRSRCRIEDMSPQHWRAACDEPLEAGMRLARSAYEHLRQRQGVILYCVPLVGSSGAGDFSALAAVAEGLRVLARSLARGWGGDGIRAHAITLHSGIFVRSADVTAATEATSLHEPALARLPSIAQVASMINLLCSPEAGSLTGASLIMDGGSWMTG